MASVPRTMFTVVFLVSVCLIHSVNAAGASTTAQTTGPAASSTVKPSTKVSQPAAKTSAKPKPHNPSPSFSPLKTTTLTPKEECSQRNRSCEYCLKNTTCMFCKTDSTCIPYPVGSVIPPSSVCALDQSRWAVCWLNFEAMIIAVSVIGGIIIIAVTTFCICCCCCRGGAKNRIMKEDARVEEQKMERKARQEDRRHERKGRLDEIRRKYGLVKDDD